VPPRARVAGDLEPGTPIRALPLEVPLGAAGAAPRGALAAWSRHVAAAQCPDAARGFWALAATVAQRGLEPAASVAALAEPPPLEPEALAPLVAAVADLAAIGCAADEAYKSPRDRAARFVRWVREAAEGLADAAALEAACRGAPADTAAERLYLAATLHGHHAAGDLPLETALQDRALRLVLARALPAVVRRRAPGDLAERQPLCAVEVAMRGHGLAEYVRGLPR
jgi:lysine-N-methylase